MLHLYNNKRQTIVWVAYCYTYKITNGKQSVGLNDVNGKQSCGWHNVTPVKQQTGNIHVFGINNLYNNKQETFVWYIQCYYTCNNKLETIVWLA